MMLGVITCLLLVAAGPAAAQTCGLPAIPVGSAAGTCTSAPATCSPPSCTTCGGDPTSPSLQAPPAIATCQPTDEAGYGCALNSSLTFYTAVRAGKLPVGSNPYPWRGDTLTNDTLPNGMPLQGGWFDAGDANRFTITMSSAVSSLAWALLDAQAGFNASQLSPYATSTIEWGADYLMNCISGSDLVAFTSAPGTIEQSHAWWGRPEDILVPSRVVMLKSGMPGADLLGYASAALTAASLAVPAKADWYLSAGKALYQQARRSEGLSSDSIPELKDVYASVTYLDKLSFAAAWLNRATGKAEYLQQAQSYFAQFMADNSTVGTNTEGWAIVIQGAGLLISRGMNGTNAAQYTAPLRFAMVEWIRGIYGITYSPEGIPTVTSWGNLRYVAKQASRALITCNNPAAYGVSEASGQAHACWAISQARLALGIGTNRSYVTGVGANPPCHAHHRGSSCPTALDQTCNCAALFNDGCNPNTLPGALLSGPGNNDSFVDSRQAYQSTEPAVDYNAPLAGMLAGILAGACGQTWDTCTAAGLTTFPSTSGLEDDYRELMDAKPFLHGLFNETTWDPAGLITIAGFFALTLMYLLWHQLKRLFESKRRAPLEGGTLRLAAARGDVGTLDLVRRWQGAAFNVDADLEGFTSLHAACVNGQAGAVAWLCSHGANVAALKDDNWRDTALHYAAASGSLEACNVLLAYGADAGAVNFAGSSPADLAVRNGYTSLAERLQGVTKGTIPRPARPEPESQEQAAADLSPQEREAAEAAVKPGFAGAGTEGTVMCRGVRSYRVLAVCGLLLHAAYLGWRAVRTLSTGWLYFYSVPFYICELMAFLNSVVFVMNLWHQIDRPDRVVEAMMPEEEHPSVDIYIVTYSESVDIVKPTMFAALNLKWPSDKLTIYVCDDGRRDAMREMVESAQAKLKSKGRYVDLRYTARDKVKGVPHHAKAGNVNSALFKEGTSKGTFVVILDCDMIVHPSFLQLTVGHFYDSQTSGWELKPKASFLQTPQDFWNMAASDPLANAGRLFFGPLQQGRDGLGAVCCCGTNVIFRRDHLVAIGGQAYHCITEDNYTSQRLAGSGFTNMYLNQRLAYGLAPDDLEGVFEQKLRWVSGAFQGLLRGNPLSSAGMTFAQRVLYFDSLAYGLMSLPNLLIVLVPLIYVFAGISPLKTQNLWEFCFAFIPYFAMTNLSAWWAYRNVIGGSNEHWRSQQSVFWLLPNQLRSMWAVFFRESPLGKMLSACLPEIDFKVTEKDAREETYWQALGRALPYAWPHMLYFAAFIAAVAYVSVRSALGVLTLPMELGNGLALCWVLLVCLMIWPVIGTLLPFNDQSEGWSIRWVQPSHSQSSIAKDSSHGSLVELPEQRAWRPGHMHRPEADLSWNVIGTAVAAVNPSKAARTAVAQDAHTSGAKPAHSFTLPVGHVRSMTSTTPAAQLQSGTAANTSRLSPFSIPAARTTSAELEPNPKPDQHESHEIVVSWDTGARDPPLCLELGLQPTNSSRLQQPSAALPRAQSASGTTHFVFISLSSAQRARVTSQGLAKTSSEGGQLQVSLPPLRTGSVPALTLRARSFAGSFMRMMRTPTLTPGLELVPDFQAAHTPPRQYLARLCVTAMIGLLIAIAAVQIVVPQAQYGPTFL